MLIYNTEKKGDKPIYEYIYECIKRDIHSGSLKSGEKLPSRRQMALDNGIAEITVANAYSQLVTEGYIESREKRGYFVSSDMDVICSGGICENVPKKKICNLDSDLCEPDAGSKEDSVIKLTDASLPEETFPFDTWSKIARKVFTDDRSACIRTPEARGLLSLRQAIAGYLERARGFSADPDHIVVGPGCEYLSNTLLQLIGGSAMVAVEDPGYMCICKVYEFSGHKCLHIPIDENGLITEGLSGSNVRMIHVSPSHHFPTGCVMSAARRASLVSWANETGAWIVEDDYDSEFRFEGKPVPPIAASDPERVIYMNTFTRTLSPSLRVAYMVLPDELFDVYSKRMDFVSGTVSTSEQLTLASFISDGYYERHLNRMRNFYRKRKKAIFEEMERSGLSGYFDVEGDGSGMTFMLRGKLPFDDRRFTDGIREQGLYMNSLDEYCYNTHKYSPVRYVVNFGSLSEERFAHAAEVMCDVMRNCLCLS